MRLSYDRRTILRIQHGNLPKVTIFDLASSHYLHKHVHFYLERKVTVLQLKQPIALLLDKTAPAINPSVLDLYYSTKRGISES